jgi:hypothetical protein
MSGDDLYGAETTGYNANTYKQGNIALEAHLHPLQIFVGL